MLACLSWIFGWKDKEECVSNPNLENLLGSNVSRNNANKNQNPFSGSHGVPKSYETFQSTIAPITYTTNHIVSQHNPLNYTSFSNVSKFTQSSSIPSAQNKQKEIVVLNTSSVTEAKDIYVDSKIEPGASEKSTENSKKTKVLPLSSNQICATQNRTINPILDNTIDPQLPHNSSSISCKLPAFESKPPKSPPSTKSDSSLLSSSFGTPLATPICPPISDKTTLPLASSNPTTGQEKTKHTWVEKGGSPLYVAKKDSKDLIKRNIGPGVLPKPLSLSSPELDPSLPSSSSGIPLAVLPKPLSLSSPELDSSLPSSLSGIPLASPKCSTISNKPSLSRASSKLTTPQTNNKHVWVKKGASSLYVVAEDFKDLFKRDIELRDLLKPLSPSSPKLDSSFPLPSSRTPPASPKCPPVSTKPILPPASSKLTPQLTKTKHVWVEKGASPLYVVAEDLKDLINRDIVSGVLAPSPNRDSLLPSSWTTPAPPKCSPASNKPRLSLASSDSTIKQSKTKYIWVEKDDSPFYVVSEDVKDLIKRDILPRVLTEPLSPPSPISDSSLPSSSFGTPPTSPKCSTLSNKPILSLASSNLTTPQTKTKYIWVEKGATPLYVVPEDFKDLIKRDTVPGVLGKPLSPSTYKDYFAALLYAEDCYFEKWDGFKMDNVSMELKIEHVSLELHKAEIHRRKGKYKTMSTSDEKDDKIFVEFEIEAVPEKRPFLLSRDFAYIRPSGTQAKPFQGIIYRVLKSTRVLVEFGKDFHEQHYPDCKYDIKFALNRVCLKRAHQAIEAASNVLIRNFLFPDCIPKSSSEELLSIHPKLDWEQIRAVHRIVIHQSPLPYLVEGPLSTREEQLTTTGKVVQEAVLQLYRISPLNRILICAPSNSTCDVLMRSLQKGIPESDIFRSNAAFRELIKVPDDILPFCPYEEEEELFHCPPLPELQKFRVILSTFMSTFRLHNEGLRAGHFSHIFLVDGSSAIEPETLVPLANLANEKTAVVVTGAPGNRSRWVRSSIARQNGLLRSYFERLRKSELYMSLDPKVISQLDTSVGSNLRLWEHGSCIF